MKQTLILDIETNGLLRTWSSRSGTLSPEADTIHCVVACDPVTGEVHKFVGNCAGSFTALTAKYECLAGHNIVAFDLPMLEKLWGFKWAGKVFDTRIASQCVWPDLQEDDCKRRMRGGSIPSGLLGSHSLKAWGYRLGKPKGNLQDQGPDWYLKFSEEMLEYCAQDVQITVDLYKLIMSKAPADRMLTLEHEFAAVMQKQENNGFTFDRAAADDLIAELMCARARLDGELTSLFPPRIITYTTPKKGIERTKEIPFNPASRDHVAWNLTNKYGWKPTGFSDKTGKPILDEAVLSKLEYPEARKLVECFTVAKRLGMIAEGKGSWLNMLRPDGRIHGGIITNGTVTGRVAHVGPNMGQVPHSCGKCGTAPCRDFSGGKIHSPYGHECRSLFTARAGWDLVGCDASGIQLRMLAHYLAPHDGGAYVEHVTNGDPHEKNRVAAGLPTRDAAKRFIYALLFGAGAAKIGSIVGGGQREGKKIIDSFMKNMKGFSAMKRGIAAAAERGFLKGLDGRKYPLRSKHVALNVLLMGGEAVVMKSAVVIFDAEMARRGMVHGVDYGHCAFVHDEIQVECRKEITGDIRSILEQSIVHAGEAYALRCPLKAESRSGPNWAATH